MTSLIYKILRPKEWLEAIGTDMYPGSADDRQSGFIHFSTIDQLSGSLNKHFDDAPVIILLVFWAEQFLPSALKWEASRDGALFPHLYDTLDIARAEDSWNLTRKGTAGFDLAFLETIEEESVKSGENTLTPIVTAND